MRSDNDVQRQRHGGGPAGPAVDELVVRQTPTGYWFVQRGDVALAGAVTQRAAERERERMLRLARRSVRRSVARV